MNITNLSPTAVRQSPTSSFAEPAEENWNEKDTRALSTEFSSGLKSRKKEPKISLVSQEERSVSAATIEEMKKSPNTSSQVKQESSNREDRKRRKSDRKQKKEKKERDRSDSFSVSPTR